MAEINNTITSQVAREISYSVLARYFPKKYSKQDIAREVKDRTAMTNLLKSMALTSLRFEKALNAFIDMIKAVLPKFQGGGLTDLSGMVSQRLDILSQMIEDFLKNRPAGEGAAQGGGLADAHSGEGGGGALGPASVGVSNGLGALGPAMRTSAQPGSFPIDNGGGATYTGNAKPNNQSTYSGQEKPLLDFISASEGTNYNTQFGYQNTTGGRPLTDMTIGEVMQAQRRQHGSSAIGRYQFMKATLPGAMAGAGLNVNDKFSPENQDKMGVFLIKSRLAKSNGTREGFGHQLSEEWASLPDPYKGGVGHYGGQNAKYSLNSMYSSMKATNSPAVAAAPDATGSAPNIKAPPAKDHVSVTPAPTDVKYKLFQQNLKNKAGLASMASPASYNESSNTTEVQPIIIYK